MVDINKSYDEITRDASIKIVERLQPVCDKAGLVARSVRDYWGRGYWVEVKTKGLILPLCFTVTKFRPDDGSPDTLFSDKPWGDGSGVRTQWKDPKNANCAKEVEQRVNAMGVPLRLYVIEPLRL